MLRITKKGRWFLRVFNQRCPLGERKYLIYPELYIFEPFKKEEMKPNIFVVGAL